MDEHYFSADPSVAFKRTPVEATIWAFGIIIVSIVVDFLRARLLNRVAAGAGYATLPGDLAAALVWRLGGVDVYGWQDGVVPLMPIDVEGGAGGHPAFEAWSAGLHVRRGADA